MRGLAFVVGMAEHLAEGVVGERFGAAVRVMDAQHLTVGLALESVPPPAFGLAAGVGYYYRESD